MNWLQNCVYFSQKSINCCKFGMKKQWNYHLHNYVFMICNDSFVSFVAPSDWIFDGGRMLFQKVHRVCFARILPDKSILFNHPGKNESFETPSIRNADSECETNSNARTNMLHESENKPKSSNIHKFVKIEASDCSASLLLRSLRMKTERTKAKKRMTASDEKNKKNLANNKYGIGFLCGTQAHSLRQSKQKHTIAQKYIQESTNHSVGYINTSITLAIKYWCRHSDRMTICRYSIFVCVHSVWLKSISKIVLNNRLFVAAQTV